MKTIIYPGTFDPITKGHVDLIERAHALFDKVVVAIAYSEKKKPMFTLEERIDLCHQSLAHLEHIEVCGFSQLLVDFARAKNSTIVLRGARSTTDFEYELQLANMNKAMLPGFETVFLTPSEHTAYISSTLVREIAAMGGDASSFVPGAVADALDQRFKKQ